ncbi:hypothetical protein BH11ACT3_BH11ACT3_21220 [soil metagenome]
MTNAVVKLVDDRWVVEADGTREYEGDDQIGALVAAQRHLASHGGGGLLIMDAAGRHLKRIVVDG